MLRRYFIDILLRDIHIPLRMNLLEGFCLKQIQKMLFCKGRSFLQALSGMIGKPERLIGNLC